MIPEYLAEFPRALEFLVQPAPYKVAYGGRGGTKSWGFARALLIQGAQQKLRIVCARETMRSIADSVHALLRDQIELLGMKEFYRVQKATIEGANGTAFTFVGLRHNPDAIKSLEGADRLWVEEAQSVSKDSWNIVIPTIRKEASEIWVSFNPRLETDDTYRRFVLNPPPGCITRKVGYQDNPWLSERLRVEIEHMKATDYKAYLNVWEGECQSAAEGAIYASEIERAMKEGRIGTVPPDRTKVVDTFWDLGFGDMTAIWLAQAWPDGSIRIIDYIEGNGKTIEHYVIQLQQKGYAYGTDWLPHDAVDGIIHHRLSGDRSRSVEQVLRAAGRIVRISPKLHVHTGINAARTIFPRCWFDEDKCRDGLTALRHYQWGEISTTGVEKQAPLHNWASHAADAFRTLAVTIKTPEREQEQDTGWRQPPPRRSGSADAWMG